MASEAHFNLPESQITRILDKLNSIQSPKELDQIFSTNNDDLGSGISINILRHQLEYGPFSSLDQLEKVKGVGPKRLTAITSAIYTFLVHREKAESPLTFITPQAVNPLVKRKILYYLNKVQNPQQLADSVELPWRDIGLKTAAKLLAYRDEWGGFSTLEQIDSVPGIGPSRFTDLVLALKNNPLVLPNITADELTPAEKEIILTRLNAFPSPEALDDAIAIPGKADIGPKLSVKIISYRDALGGFESLSQLQEVEGIGPSRFTDLVYGLLSENDITEEEDGKTPNRSPAIMRSRVAKYFQRHFGSATPGDPIVAGDTIGTAFELLQGYLEEPEKSYVGALLTEAITMEAITWKDRIMDIMHFPQIAPYWVMPPKQLYDPATLPGIHPETRWARTCDTVFIFPESDLSIAVLAGGYWEQVGVFRDPIALVPTTQGMSVRRVMEGPLAPVGVGAVITPGREAVRLTCEAGIKGVFSGPVKALSGNPEHRPSVPLGWSFPNTEIWVNPIPNPPVDFFSPTHEEIFLPGGVVVAGRKKPPEEESGEEETGCPVLVGFYPRVAIAVWPRRPWPWGPYRWPWPLPWPPKPQPPGPDSPGAGIGGGFGVIYLPDPVLAITVKILGCECIRRPETKTYRADPIPDGGTFKWTIDDTSIATIEGPDTLKEVKVKAVDIGDVTLTLDYELNGQKAQASMGIEIIYHKFTPRNNPTGEIPAVPLFQPVPKVRVTPANHPYKLDEIQPENRRARFFIDFEGVLLDALVDIESVEISGKGFKRSLSRSENEYGKFSDDKFIARKVEVFGPGRSYIRIKTKNSIGLAGTETLEVIISLNDHYYSSIRSYERSLEYSRSHDDSDQVKFYEERLLNVWKIALEFVKVRYGYLNHTDNSTPKIPASEKWSIAVEDDETLGFADINTSHDAQFVVLEEKRKELLAPMVDPKNYFVLHQDYTKDRVNWEEDGKLLGAAGEPASLVYVAGCCSHSIPVVGVEIAQSPGVHRIKKGESITLDANGLPPSFLGISGIYEWEVVAHPEGAEFRFEPEQPATASMVEFYTNTPGLYTFKVKYSLLGVTSPWTYAETDCQVIFQVETRTVIRRIGPYNDNIKQHLDRPYYRERTMDPQFGTEILVENKETGPLGKDLELKILCPKELQFSDSIKARAFYPTGDYEDYTILVDKDFGFLAEASIKSIRPIEKLHIIGIKYGNLPAYPGTAVWVDVRVKNLAPPVVDLEEVTPPPATGGTTGNGDAGNTVTDLGGTYITTDSEGKPIDLYAPDESIPGQPIVNLILRPRDLGRASACNAVLNWFPVDGVNLTNGNHYQALPLFDTEGHGENTLVSLHYNSQAALRSYGLKSYGEINGKTPEKVAEEFGTEPYGRGWTGGPMAMMLWEFVDPDGEDINHSRLLECLEVVMPDGNRVAFKKDYTGKYTTCSDAETLDDDPDGALNLELAWTEADEQWKMTDEEENYWLFDKQGRLVETGSALTDHTLAEPMKIVHSDVLVEVTDSVGRKTKLEMENGRISKITNPEQIAFSIEYDTDHWLKKVAFPLQISWAFQYTKNGLMNRLEPPEGKPLQLFHYLGESIETVPKNIAKDFWGRVARLEMGDRRWSIRYSNYDKDNQVVECLDPEDHHWKYQYEPKRQAATKVEYANSQAVVQFRHYAAYTYRLYSKAIDTFTNLNGASTSYYYKHARGRDKGQLPGSTIFPGTRIVNYTYNEKNLLTSVKNEVNETTIYTYTPFRELEQITYPSIPIITADLNETTAIPVKKNAYDDKGRLETQISMLGVVTSFAYHDPQTGLPTHITKDGQTAEYQYDIMGRLTNEKAANGLVTKHTYNDLGWNNQASIGDLVIDRTFDNLGRLKEESDNLNRKSLHEYDAYHQLKKVTDAENHVHVFNDYDKSGFLRKETYPNGAEYNYYDVDALGRKGMVTYPDVARNLPDNRLRTENMAEKHSIFHDELAAHPLLNEEVYHVEISQGLRTSLLYFNGMGWLRAEAVHMGDHIVTQVYHYDDKGRGKMVEWYDDGQRKGMIKSQSWNALDQVFSEAQGEVTKKSCTWFDDNGIYEVEKYPAQARQTGRNPSSLRRLDSFGRTVKELDGFGRLVTEYHYDDQQQSCLVKSADPSILGDDQAMIEILQLTYNQWGKVAQQADKRTQESTTYSFDLGGRVTSLVNRLGTSTFDYDKLNRVRKLTSPVPGSSGAVAIPPAIPNLQETANSTQTIYSDYDALGNKTRYGTDDAEERVDYDLLGRPIQTIKTGLGTGQTQTEELSYNELGEVTAHSYGPGEYYQVIQNHKLRYRIEALYSQNEHFSKTVYVDGLGQPYRTVWHEYGAWEFENRKDSGGRTILNLLKRNNKTIWEEAYEYYRERLLPDHARLASESDQRFIYFGYNAQFQVTSVQDDAISSGTYEFYYNRSGQRIGLKRPHSPYALTTYRYTPNGHPLGIGHRFGEQYDQYYNIAFDATRYDTRGNPGRITHEYVNQTPIDTDGIDLGIAAGNSIPAWEEHRYDAIDRLIFSKYRGLRNGLAHNMLSTLAGAYWQYLVGGSVLLSAQYLYNRQKLESEVRKYYAYDGKGRQTIQHVELIPEPGGDPNDHKHLIHQQSYGTGQAVKTEAISWYETTLSNPKTIEREFIYDRKGRRKMIIEKAKDAANWSLLTRYYYGMGDKPNLIRKLSREDDEVKLEEEQFLQYDPAGRRVYARTVVYDEAPLVQHQWQSLIDGRRSSRPASEDWLMRHIVKSDDSFYYGYAGADLVGIYNTKGERINSFLNGPAANERLASYNRGQGERVYHLDHQQNATVFTESDGDVSAWAPQHSTFGAAMQQVPEAVKLGMWGHVTDFLTTTFREYDPGIGQFISPDPVGLAAGVNRYNFANGNPLVYNDPSGLVVETPFDIASLGLDIVSFVSNIASGNIPAAFADGMGMAFDIFATAVPGVPAVGGHAVRASRMIKKLENIDDLRHVNDTAILKKRLERLDTSLEKLMYPQGLPDRLTKGPGFILKLRRGKELFEPAIVQKKLALMLNKKKFAPKNIGEMNEFKAMLNKYEIPNVGSHMYKTSGGKFRGTIPDGMSFDYKIWVEIKSGVSSLSAKDEYQIMLQLFLSKKFGGQHALFTNRTISPQLHKAIMDHKGVLYDLSLSPRTSHLGISL